MKHQPSDNQPELPAAVIACALIVASVFIVASLADEKNSQDGWVYRYQTLITGVFAVGAAYLTVWQMRNTDAESERRHRELARLQVRSERLKIERMLFPQFGELREHYKQLKKFTLPSLIITASEEAKNEAFFAFADEGGAIERTSLAITQILSREAWAGAEPLFGGFLRYELERLTEDLNKLTWQGKMIRQYSSEKAKSRRIGDAWKTSETGYRRREQTMLNANTALLTVSSRMERVFKLLYELADNYEIEG